jgi:hypothetical protein
VPPCWSYDATTFAWAGRCAAFPLVPNTIGNGLIIVNPVFFPPTANGSACQWRCNSTTAQADLSHNDLLGRWEFLLSVDNYATVIEYILADASWVCNGNNTMTLLGNSTGCTAPATITLKPQNRMTGSPPYGLCGDTLCDPFLPFPTNLHVTFQSSQCAAFNFSLPLIDQGGSPRSWSSALFTYPGTSITDIISLQELDPFISGCPAYVLLDTTGIPSCAYFNSPQIFNEDCPSRVCIPFIVKFPQIPINWDPGTGNCPVCVNVGSVFLFASAIVTL